MLVQSYLSFCLGEEHFASPVNKVLNILEMCPITPVPLSPSYMVGVINLRGSVLPLIDMRVKFGMEPTQIGVNTCVLVLDIISEGESVFVGALVDSVQEVLELSDEDILPPPNLGARFRTEFISGLSRKHDKFVMIVDMDAVFSLTSCASTVMSGVV